MPASVSSEALSVTVQAVRMCRWSVSSPRVRRFDRQCALVLRSLVPQCRSRDTRVLTAPPTACVLQQAFIPNGILKLVTALQPKCFPVQNQSRSRWVVTNVPNKTRRQQSHCQKSHWRQSQCQQSHCWQSHCQKSHWRQSQCQQSQCRQSHCWQSHCRQSQYQQSHCRQSHCQQSQCQQSHCWQSHCQKSHCRQSHCRQSQCRQSHCRQSHCQQSTASKTIVAYLVTSTQPDACYCLQHTARALMAAVSSQQPLGQWINTGILGHVPPRLLSWMQFTLQYPLFLWSVKISPPLVRKFCSHRFCLLIITSCTKVLVYETSTCLTFSFYYCIVSSTDTPGSYICVMKREFMYLFSDCCNSHTVTLMLKAKFLPQPTTNFLIQRVTIHDVYRSAASVCLFASHTSPSLHIPLLDILNTEYISVNCSP